MERPQSHITRDRAKVLLERWGKILNYSSDKVKPIEDERTRINTALMLENQKRFLMEDANVAGSVFGSNSYPAAGLNQLTPAGDNYAQGDHRLPKILIPMIRRTFPELITNEIVGVQPMGGPVGLVFALRYKYESEALGAEGAGRDGNSSLSTVHPSNASDEREIGYNYLDTRFTGSSSGALSGLGAGSDFEFVAQDQGVAKLLSEFELTGNIPQVTISFEKTSVEAGTRRLAARWSVELEQDLKNMNGIDIDTELTNTMSYEIQAEIDREMIMRMVQVALNAGFPRGYSVWSPASADGRWIAERNRDLYAKIIVEANRIAVRNRRGAANFLIATPRVCAILEMLPEFQWMQVQGNINTQPTGVARVGNLGGRFNVYRDTRTEAQWDGIGHGSKNPTSTPSPRNSGNRVEYILLGYKGPEFFDTGIIYAPYIPIMVQRTVGTNDFGQRVGLMTRYGVVDNIFGADLYYHCIIITRLGEAFTPGTNSVYF